MNEEEFLIRTDGKNVKITSSELVVDGARYLIKSIKNVRLHFVRHYKYPPLTLLVIGIICMVAGISGWAKTIKLEEIYIGNFLITSERLFLIAGFVVALLGVLWLSILHNEYVLVISTEEGDRNPISGRKKDELSKIFSKLRSAMKSFQNEESLL